MSENFSLNDIMANSQQPRMSTTFVDLTANNVEANTTNETPKPTPVSIKPIQSGPMGELKQVNIESILPKRQPAPNAMEENLYADLDAAVDREISSITERVDALTAIQLEEMQAQAKKEEERLQDEEDAFAIGGSARVPVDTYDTESDNVNAIPIRINNRYAPVLEDEVDEDAINKSSIEEVNNESVESEQADVISLRSQSTEKINILDNVNDEDLFADDEEAAMPSNEPTTDTEDLLNDLKNQVKKKVTPIKNAIDLTKFSIAQKAISAQKVMKLAVQSHQNIADWILYSSQRPISMTGLSGPEILKLNPDNSNRNRLNTFRDMYRVIYDHIYDGNKPDFETWLKQTRFVDLQHIYFALYMATFGGSNFVNYSCQKCEKVFIKDVKFEDMVEYADNDARAKVRNILKMDSTSPSNDSYPVDLEQVSDSYVFALRTPSVWNVVIETASLSDQFLEKHADLIDMVAYIDAIYVIDTANQTLIPVDTKPDPNDTAKTAGRRIKAFYDIIRTLSSEEYYSLRSKITEYDEDATKVSYKIPACTCPHCAAEIPANTDITPDSMLFTRHQLAALGSM